jgi:hypothetical protein
MSFNGMKFYRKANYFDIYCSAIVILHMKTGHIIPRQLILILKFP